MCRSSVNRIWLIFILSIIGLQASATNSANKQGLKDVFEGKFLIGAALNTSQISGRDTSSIKILKRHFNSIVAENCMKSGLIQPEEGKFDFTLSDQFVKLGEENNLFIVGHNLVWHSQAPRWFFTDSNGNDVSRDVLIDRMKTHIYTVVGRYKGRVDGWDVVNEAILDDGSLRKSKFYEIIGPEYLRLAFQFAHEADPDAELYYNDYSMALPGKRDGVVSLVKDLQNQGLRIDGVGMQAHCSMNFPAIEDFEKSIAAFSALNVKVMITEFDLSVLPSPKKMNGADVDSQAAYLKELNPYTDGLPDSVLHAQTERFNDFFNLFLKYQDHISRVTFWGITDAHSWKNNWPIRGRIDYPLLFDRNYQPKEFVKSLLNESSSVR